MDLQEIEREARRKLEGCRKQKDDFRADIEEAYFFTAPRRARSIRESLYATTSLSNRDNNDADLLQISIAMECAEDFATTLIASFMPKGLNWMDQELPPGIKGSVAEPELREQAMAETEIIFELMRGSNFDAALAMSLVPDASVGLHAVLIKNTRGDKPVHCIAVPIADLEVDVCGVTGMVGARFLRKVAKAEDVAAILSDIKLSDEWLRKLKGWKDKKVVIRWGFWPLYGQKYDGDAHWQHVVMVDDKAVHEAVLKGEGSCELVCARFNPLPEYAYGEGPAIKALPELRHLDDLAAGETEHIDWTLRPAHTFPDDSFANIENGVEPATFIPVRPGTAADVKPLFQPGQIDAALFDQQARERRVKRMFYMDMPEQRGDTPPTATQWVDEMAMAQRRIGTPGEQYWREGPLEFFKRFKYIAKARGLVGKQGALANMVLTPSNPAKRAQDMQKAQNGVRACQVGGALFPEEFKLKVDGGKTFERFVELMGADGVVVMRSSADIQAAAQLIGQVAGGQPQGDVPVGPAGGM